MRLRERVRLWDLVFLRNHKLPVKSSRQVDSVWMLFGQISFSFVNLIKMQISLTGFSSIGVSFENNGHSGRLWCHLVDTE